MKIAFLWCGSVTAGWSIGDGLARAFAKAGHQVLRIPRGRQECPLVTIQALNVADVIVVSGPEHIFRAQVKGEPPNPYTFTADELTVYEWLHEVKPPKIFLYHESNHREDQTFGLEDYLTYADYHFFPAVQDAETYDQEHFAKGRSFWLPFGVDTDVFKPVACECQNYFPFRLGLKITAPTPDTRKIERETCRICLGTGTLASPKDIDVGFIGLIYPKRQLFIERLSQHVKAGNPIPIAGHVQVLDVDGPAWTDQALRLAQNYRRMKVFLNFPAYSELLVSKIVEVMACGTFILTPMLEGAAEANCTFQHGKELAYYHPTNLPFLVQTWREFSERDALREEIALSGMRKVHEKYSLKVQVPEILEKCKVETKKEVVQ